MAPNYTLRRAVALGAVFVVGWGAYTGVTSAVGMLAASERPDAVATPAEPPASPEPAASTPTAPATKPAAKKATPSPTPTRTQATTPPSDTPFQVKGVVVVSRFHPLTRAYVPDSQGDPDGLLPEVREAATRMFADAKTAGLPLAVRSGYRSYAVQDASFKRAWAQYGAGARRYYAEAGHSEHQTGLAFDLSDGKSHNQKGYKFAKTPQAGWVAQNAHRYGFIIRYPEGKRDITGVDHEPWHVRYVGEPMAAEMARTPGISLEEFLGLV